MPKKTSFIKKVIWSLVIILVITTGVGGYFAYKILYQSNINLGDKKSQLIYIRTGYTFDDVVNILGENGLIINRTSFVWLAKQMHYPENVKPGKYRILAGTGNRALLRMLRSGKQEPVIIPLDNLHTKEQLITRVCIRLEADSTELRKMLEDDAFLKKSGLAAVNAMALFHPDTYEFLWNTSSMEFMERMMNIHEKFWTPERKQKAKLMNKSLAEVTTLASIVEQEQSKYNDEKRMIAGLYLNRLKKDMLLQADPTVVFATGDFTINRVLNKHKETDSPYNTYMYKGLPPGPICLPEASSIDAVLNYDHNDYLYMCAKEDFSGRHYFSKSYEQHQVYAKKYRDALDKNNIRK